MPLFPAGSIPVYTNSAADKAGGDSLQGQPQHSCGPDRDYRHHGGGGFNDPFFSFF